MNIKSSVVTLAAISGLLLTGCGSQSIFEFGKDSGIKAEKLKFESYDTNNGDEHDSGNFDESKAFQIKDKSNNAMYVKTVTDHGVVVTDLRNKWQYVDLKSHKSFSMVASNSSNAAPLDLKWKGKEYIAVTHAPFSPSKGANDPLSNIANGDYLQNVSVYDVDTGKLVKTHEFSVLEGKEGWMPIGVLPNRGINNSTSALVAQMTPSLTGSSSISDRTYGLRVIDPVTGATTDEVTGKDDSVEARVRGFTPEGRIISSNPHTYVSGYDGHEFPVGAIVTATLNEYVMTQSSIDKANLFLIEDGGPKEVASSNLKCNPFGPSHISPNGRYVLFGQLVFDVESKTTTCFMKTNERSGFQPSAVDDNGNVYGDGNVTNIAAGKTTKVRNSPIGITKDGFAIFTKEHTGSFEEAYFIPVK